MLGYQVWIWGTIPPGTGTNVIDISIDGGAPNTTTRASNGSAVYNEPYFESSLLRETYHTIVITNRGSDAKGNTEFLLDRFEFESSDNVPLFTTTGSSTTLTSTLPPTATSPIANAPSSSGSKTPWGAIIGVIVAVFLLLIGVLLFLLWRRRRRNSAGTSEGEKQAKVPPGRPSLAPVPFPLPRKLGSTSGSSTSPQSGSDSANAPFGSPNHISEKAGFQRTLQLSSISSPIEAHTPSLPTALASSTTLETAASSQPLVPVSETTTSSNPMPSFNDVTSSMYSRSSQPQASIFENPPPYQNGPAGS